MRASAPAIPSPGDLLAGLWRVERILGEEGGIRTLLVEGDADGRALCFLLPDEVADPDLDERAATAWGTVRTILRDERFGRICIDEIAGGPLLSERLEAGWRPPAAWCDELEERVAACHRDGLCHGRIQPETIVLAPGAPQLAGWGLGAAAAEDLRALDLAALRRIRAAAREEGAEERPEGGPPSLTAAIRSDQIATLRSAIEAAERDRPPGGPAEAELARARDALRRLEARLDRHLTQARALLDQGDPLGAVAACREAIHLGAEAEAAPLLREARRQARRMLGRDRYRPLARRLAPAAGGALLLLAALLAWFFTGPPSPRKLAEQQAEAHGERAACRLLAAMQSRGELGPDDRPLLGEHLSRLLREERQRLLELRSAAISQGARPQRADDAAESTLAMLERIAASPPEVGLEDLLRDTFGELDRAAALYRATLHLSVAEAEQAVASLVRADPLLAGGEENAP